METAALIDRYCEAWTEPDPQRRIGLLRAVWTPTATYTDPNVHTEGADGLLAHIARVQATRPGARVLRVSAVDAHHGVARFAFRVVAPDGAVLREGLDIAFLSADGARIERIIGFFGALEDRA